jgi:hypothetical protein
MGRSLLVGYYVSICVTNLTENEETFTLYKHFLEMEHINALIQFPKIGVNILPSSQRS